RDGAYETNNMQDEPTTTPSLQGAIEPGTSMPKRPRLLQVIRGQVRARLIAPLLGCLLALVAVVPGVMSYLHNQQTSRFLVAAQATATAVTGQAESSLADSGLLVREVS